jgi:predicted transcriptional regulator
MIPMKKPLLDVIFASEKRMNTLLLLHDGPKEMEYILRSLKATRQALLPQVRILEDHRLVTGSNDVYGLTHIGKLLVDKMNPLMVTLEVFNDDIDYWGTHNLDFIPPHLFERLRELGKCKEVNLTLTESYQLNQEIVRTTFMSEAFYVITSFFHPDYPAVFTDMVQKDVKLYIITTKNVVDTMRTYHYEVFDRLLNSKSFNLFVHSKEMGIQVVAHNDHCLLLRLLTSEGHIDINHMLCSSPESLVWGKELFQYYLKNSQPVTEL